MRGISVDVSLTYQASFTATVLNAVDMQQDAQLIAIKHTHTHVTEVHNSNNIVTI